MDDTKPEWSSREKAQKAQNLRVFAVQYLKIAHLEQDFLFWLRLRRPKFYAVVAINSSPANI
jgi:hypothetical protein